MALDPMCVGTPCAFDHVGVDRSLPQESFYVALCTRSLRGDMRGLALKDANEFLTDDVSLTLRIGDALQRVQEILGGVDGDQLYALFPLKGLYDLLWLIQAHQAVVDENAGQLIAYGAMDEHSRHCRVDPAA